MAITPLDVKLKNVLRIDRALRFVWQAGPGWCFASLGLIILQGLFPLISLYLLKLIIDGVAQLVQTHDSVSKVISYKDTSQVILYIVFAGCAVITSAVVTFFSDYTAAIQSHVVSDRMYSILHSKSIEVDLAFYETPDYKDSLHRAQSEGPYRPTRIVNGLINSGQNLASLMGVMWILLLFNPILPIILFCAVIPGILLRLNYSKKIFYWQKNRTEDERKSSYFNWILTGEAHARELRLFGLGNYFIERFQKLRKTLRTEKLAFEKMRGAGDLAAQSCATIAVFGSLIYIASETLDGHITLGDMAMYFQAFQKGLSFIKSFFESIAGLYEDNLFLSYFYEFLDIKPKITEPRNPEPIPKHRPVGVTIQNVTFRYENCEKNVIQDLNLVIEPGELVAVVGNNGSGKSTIVKLLCRLYDPVSGKIFLDGGDITRFGLHEYRKQISVVFQDFARYFLTAAENIWVGDVTRDMCPEAIVEAAKKAGINDLLKAFPSGYDTMMGRWFKGGEELSTGQWQMLALARFFYKDASFVILDEPTSSLDANTEFQIFTRFKDLVRGKSALIISHRFSTVKMADRILVLDQGRISENGSHEELMTKNGHYASLFRQQSSQYLQGTLNK